MIFSGHGRAFARQLGVFERYAIVSQNDIADAMVLLQCSEKVNDPQIGYCIGHSDIPTQERANLRNVN